MTPVLRRILMTALIAALAGLGVFTALLSRRPRRQVARAEVTIPVLPSPPASRSAGGGRGLALGLVCLLLLMGSAGIVYESRDVLFGGAPRGPTENAKPLAALSPPEARTAQPMVRANGITTGSVPASQTGDDSVTVQPPRPSTSPAPGFDVVRIEPNGDAVFAGQAAPNATVELLVDGKPVDRARANAGGRFTVLPPTLPTGNSEISLRTTNSTGDVQRSLANVSVVVAQSRDAKPLVAVTSPDRPTLVMSQPDLPATPRPGLETVPSGQSRRDDGDASTRPDATETDRDRAKSGGGTATAGTKRAGVRAGADGRGDAEPSEAKADTSPDSPNPDHDSRSLDQPVAASTPLKVVAIDARDGGKLFVRARAAAGADVRLYLNDTLIAPATVGRDGTVTFAIGHGVRPGAFKVRLDLVDPATGKVRDRAEVPFSAPAAGQDQGVEYAGGNDATRHRGSAEPVTASQPSSTGSLAANRPRPAEAGTSEVYVPGIETTRIERGDSLWRISRRTYGEGERYTVIYDANQDQIRDPDLIYPGQVFVLPRRDISGASKVGKRD